MTHTFIICYSSRELQYTEMLLDGYNAEEKRPENAYIKAIEYGLNEKVREEEQQEQQEVEQSQSQSQSQSQDQIVIVCSANARCIIEQRSY